MSHFYADDTRTKKKEEASIGCRWLWGGGRGQARTWKVRTKKAEGHGQKPWVQLTQKNAKSHGSKERSLLMIVANLGSELLTRWLVNSVG